jgi:hypothetical protein
MENIANTFRTVQEAIEGNFFHTWENVSGYTGGDGAIPADFTETINYYKTHETTEGIDIIVQGKVEYENGVVKSMGLNVKRENV